MILKFGKHKGKDIQDVPTDYLFWLLENTDPEDRKYGEKNKLLRQACENAINAKSDGLVQKSQKRAPETSGSLTMGYVLADMRELIDKIYANAGEVLKTMDIFEEKFVSKKDPF